MEYSANNGDNASPPLSTDWQAEVARLTEALQKEQDKLVRWKEKAQSGVDMLRQRVVDLTTSLESVTAEKAALEQTLSSGHGEAGPTHSSSLCPCVTRTDAYLSTMEAALSTLVLTKTDAIASAMNGVASLSTMSTRGDMEVYKRRMETTLRLQSKSNDALQHQVQELQTALASLRETLQERDRTLEVGDATVSALEQRLKEALDDRAALEAQRSNELNGPNMEELNQLEERYESALQRERGEYAARENAIFAQHTQELQRQTAHHDAEMHELQNEWQRRLQTAVDEASRQQKKQAQEAVLASAAASKDSAAASDVAYTALLREHEALKSEFQALQAQCRTLKAVSLASAAAQPSSLATASADAAETLTLPDTLAGAHTALASQFTTIQQLSQELWSLKREVLDMKRRASERAQAPAPDAASPLTPQQFAYLRSVVVNVLCYHKDAHLVMNLLPVLSTLLQMTPADLRQVCTANPSWASK